MKLACASLDAVKQRYPELRDRKFTLRAKQALALDTMVRLDARLSTGAPCFNALAFVERVAGAAPDPVTMTLAIVAMDEGGRELVASMGGKPPKPLPEGAMNAGGASGTDPIVLSATMPPSPAPSLTTPLPPRSASPAPADAPAAIALGSTLPPAPKLGPLPTFKAPPAGLEGTPPPSSRDPAPAAAPDAEEPPGGAPDWEEVPAPDWEEVPAPEWEDDPEPQPAAAQPKPPAPPVSAEPRVAVARPKVAASSAAVLVPGPKAAPAESKPPAAEAKPAPARPAPPPPPRPPPSRPAPREVALPKVPAAAAAPSPREVAPPAARLPEPAAPDWDSFFQAPDDSASAPPAWEDPPAQQKAPDAPGSREGSKKPQAATPPRAAAATPTAPARAVPSAPPLPPPSRRPAPPPLPRPTLAPGAAAAAEAKLVEDSLPDPTPETGKKGRIIGIDLGTTNSAAAVVKEGKAFIIPSREGYNTIPSVVALNEKGNIIVGHQAKGQLLINPKTTVYGFKRLVGRQFRSPVVSDLVGRFSYEIAQGLRGEASVKLGDKIYSLQKISSLVLSEVKELAERWLNEPVSRAVITVPAYYNDNQRQAVRAAGALAGLDVERILNEPTAAAVAFAHGRTLEERVMVYDLGGGTFDTSVLQLHGSVYEVISTGGDTFLGGVDFDKELVNDLLARFKRKHDVDFSGDRVAYQRINDAAERAKISLSERLSTQIKVPFVAMVNDKAYDVDETVTRADLEKLTSQLVDRTLKVCDEVLTNCGLKPADIGEVLLVGGQSRMPLVRQKIKDFFGREPSRAVHPDEAVALGAALLADSIQTGEIGGMVLMDVLPMSIGVGLPGGRFKKIVERNTSLPHKKTHSVWTSQDQQKMLEVPIFQGESSKAVENEYLGTLVVADLPPGHKGDVVFDIIFSISPESILTVTAEERGTARSVTATFSTQDTPEAVRRRLASSPSAGSAQHEEPNGEDKAGLFGWFKRKLS